MLLYSIFSIKIQTLCVPFRWTRLTAYPISTAVSSTNWRVSSLMSLAPFNPLETVLVAIPSFFAMSLINDFNKNSRKPHRFFLVWLEKTSFSISCLKRGCKSFFHGLPDGDLVAEEYSILYQKNSYISQQIPNEEIVHWLTLPRRFAIIFSGKISNIFVI